MTHHLESYGLVLVFVLIALECCGIPLPGESALITAAVLAGNGHFNIVEVIAVAAAAAIVGDNAGYWIGRIGGRALLERTPIVRDTLPKYLPRGERFFEQHGPKTVVIGRFIAGLRITVAWLAGISRMPWKQFLVYNATGGILWATAVGVAAYVFGKQAVDAVTHYGLFAVIGLIVLVIAAFVAHRFLHHRMNKEADPPPAAAESQPVE